MQEEGSITAVVMQKFAAVQVHCYTYASWNNNLLLSSIVGFAVQRRLSSGSTVKFQQGTCTYSRFDTLDAGYFKHMNIFLDNAQLQTLRELHSAINFFALSTRTHLLILNCSCSQ